MLGRSKLVNSISDMFSTDEGRLFFAFAKSVTMPNDDPVAVMVLTSYNVGVTIGQGDDVILVNYEKLDEFISALEDARKASMARKILNGSKR